MQDFSSMHIISLRIQTETFWSKTIKLFHIFFLHTHAHGNRGHFDPMTVTPRRSAESQIQGICPATAGVRKLRCRLIPRCCSGWQMGSGMSELGFCARRGVCCSLVILFRSRNLPLRLLLARPPARPLVVRLLLQAFSLLGHNGLRFVSLSLFTSFDYFVLHF